MQNNDFFDDINNKLNNISAYLESHKQNQQNNIQLKEKIIYTYMEFTVKALRNTIINSKDQSEFSRKLKDFLSNHWQMINGTAVCYTAIPKNDITILLCDIAKKIANQEEVLIKLLMPTINIEHISDTQNSIPKFL